MSDSKRDISRLYVGHLKALSPLHVGSGEYAERGGVEGKADGGGPPLVRLVARDLASMACIPGTTLKGLLSRLMIDDEERKLLAGDIKAGRASDDGDQGRMGALQVRGATLAAAGRMDDLPYVHRLDRGQVGDGIFIAARAAIDGDTGVASDAKLFFQEMVVPATLFRFEVLAAPRRLDELREVCVRLERALAALGRPEGVALGSGQADGFGRIKLEGPVTITARAIDTTTGEVSDGAPRHVDLSPTPADARVIDVAFRCDGPFLIADPSRGRQRLPDSDDATASEPHLRPQRLEHDLPLVLGPSLSGALRSRAEWLAAVMKIGTDKTRVKVVRGRDVPGHPVDRLFGVTGFRGLLSVRSITMERAAPWNVMSVKIDRFSGAPIDNALFGTETFIGVRFTAALVVESRGKKASPSPDDRALLDQLLEDITDNGLQLGAGGNKGFGWFAAEVNSHADDRG